MITSLGVGEANNEESGWKGHCQHLGVKNIRERALYSHLHSGTELETEMMFPVLQVDS